MDFREQAAPLTGAYLRTSQPLDKEPASLSHSTDCILFQGAVISALTTAPLSLSNVSLDPFLLPQPHTYNVAALFISTARLSHSLTPPRRLSHLLPHSR